ncbi:hypothetical protein [Georgenia sp. Z1491]|uniref:hypothetical protein n=1 Tax=Georgenia sp. Z1491 TaxID=3416707 RepID=UPI003CF43D73
MSGAADQERPRNGATGDRDRHPGRTRLLVVLVVALVAANVYLWFDGWPAFGQGGGPDGDAGTVGLGEPVPVGAQLRGGTSATPGSAGTLRVDEVEVGAPAPRGFRETDGRYVVPRVVVESDSDQIPLHLDSGRLRVVDEEGRRYAAVASDEQLSEHAWLMGGDVTVDAGGRTSGRLVVDLPADAVPDALWVPAHLTSGATGDVLVELR